MTLLTLLHADLISNVRYIDSCELKEDFSFCLSLANHTTREQISVVTDQFCNGHNVKCHTCKSVCTDKAAGMTGKIKRFITIDELLLVLQEIIKVVITLSRDR